MIGEGFVRRDDLEFAFSQSRRWVLLAFRTCERESYNPYHYPGFPSGEGWNETATLKVMRAKAFEIRGLKESPVEIPAPPKLFLSLRPQKFHGKDQWERRTL